MFQNITEVRYHTPNHLGTSSKDIIKAFLQYKPSLRIGMKLGGVIPARITLSLLCAIIRALSGLLAESVMSIGAQEIKDHPWFEVSQIQLFLVEFQ